MSADVDAEQEVDFGRLARRVLARWWLPVGGLVIGVAIGYAATLGGSNTYRAEAILALGTPFTSNGSPIAGLTNNPRAVTELANAQNALVRANAAGGPPARALTGKIAIRTIGSGLPGKAQGPPIVGIAVKGSRPKRVADAANSIAATVASSLTQGFVNGQVKAYLLQLQTQNAQLAVLKDRIANLQVVIGDKSLSPINRLLLVTQLDNAEQRSGTLLDAKSQTQQSLLLANNIEAPRILSRAVAVQTTARSKHNSMAVGGLIGLILGLLAALLWDWTAGRMNRRPAV